MELVELSTQLKTFDIVDSQNTSNLELDKMETPVEENRRLTRSKSMPKSDIRTPVTEFTQKVKKVVDPDDEIKKIYLNTKVKLVHKNLETIFEDPIVRKGNTMFFGIGKQKRSLYLCREFRTTTRQKSKMRKMKIKRLGKRVKPLKMIDEFREKMMKIDDFINCNNVEEKEIEKDENYTNADVLPESNNEMQTP